MTRVVTVTLNPALDITYAVPAFAVGSSVRVETVRSRAGGKGVNVAAVVRQLGGDAVVVAPGARAEPDPFRDGLDTLGLPHHLIPAFASVRRTVAVVGADGPTTILLEPGSPAPAGTADAIAATVAGELAGAGALVISGSVPPGLPDDLPARLARLAGALPVIVDVSGPALRAAIGAGAVLVPNRAELADIGAGPPVTVARGLLDQGAAAVVVTLGEEGAVAVTPGGAWHARTPEVVDGNPTGAGDAATAALALRLACSSPWPTALTDAVATSAACVLRPVAGEIDLDARRRWLGAITVEELP
ncbi:tagatose-6-phosphate kinase [Paractinoplanes abujensis]|uniref:1-phosphofructokinase/tagatose 6-phosphate kinase n=1 Tax=Paractinoplanes abujensis TaxID=882441 RepID=A0A7W7CU32_9ACTN|nr:hexose kinase [Actinoplanes abujensis]MBB4693006.1 1-phosphofructokinase/tagatose 6-phosphate kinase [Actinoplanes abujensis]GID22490.1 tagatose-6-phosphate kinase [Actinoplanes abujensis]